MGNRPTWPALAGQKDFKNYGNLKTEVSKIFYILYHKTEISKKFLYSHHEIKISKKFIYPLKTQI